MTEKNEPSNLRLVASTRHPKQRKKHNPLAPRLPIVEVPEPPADMSDTGKAAWLELAAVVNGKGIYTKADMWAYEALAASLGDLRTAQETLSRPLIFDGVEVSPAGAKHYRCGDRQLIRPDWRFARSAERRFLMWAAKFRLPMAERVRLAAAPSDDGNPFKDV